MLLAPVLGFTGALAVVLFARADRAGWAFMASSLTMTGIILTAGFSMFPFVMPSITEPGSSLTLWDAASSHLTLTVMFWAVVVFLPLILGYTAWTYRAMWGRVTVQQIREHTHSAY
jgi:cytochrome d ubiquinol oxidase subunit II